MQYYRNIEIIEEVFIDDRKLYKVVICGNCVLVDKEMLDKICDLIDIIEKGDDDARN